MEAVEDLPTLRRECDERSQVLKLVMGYRSDVSRWSLNACPSGGEVDQSYLTNIAITTPR